MPLDCSLLTDEDLIELLSEAKIGIQDIAPERLTDAFLLEGCRQIEDFSHQLSLDQFFPAVQRFEAQHLRKALYAKQRNELPEDASYAEVVKSYLGLFPINIYAIHPSFLSAEDVSFAIHKNPRTVKTQNPKLWATLMNPALANSLIEKDLATIDLVDPWVLTDESLIAGIRNKPLRLPNFNNGEPFRRLIQFIKNGHWPNDGVWIALEKPKTVSDAVQVRMSGDTGLATNTLLDAYLCTHPLASLERHVKDNDLLMRLITHYPKEDVLSTFKENLVVVGKLFQEDLGL